MTEEPSIGIIAALTMEFVAVRMVLDDVREQRATRDPHQYLAGSVPSDGRRPPHQVVVIQQTRDGTRDAAASVTTLIQSFPSVRYILMCGIAAGLPTAEIRLGDIVSATEGVVDYGHLRITDGHRLLRRAPGDVSADLLRADHQLAAEEIGGRRPWIPTLAGLEAEIAAFRRPAPDGTPAVHRGAIASGDVLLRDAALRDDLARRHRVIAYEMEAAGVAAAARSRGREWYMVRGVADLADRRKDDRWHGYAAATAASYLRALLGRMEPEGAGAAPGSTAAMSQVVDAMLASRFVRDEHNRQQLLELLPLHIRAGIAYSPVARIHVISIIRTCQDYPDGLEALVDAMGLLLGTDTAEFGRLAGTIRRSWGTP